MAIELLHKIGLAILVCLILMLVLGNSDDNNGPKGV